MGRAVVLTCPAARALTRILPETEALIREKLRLLADTPEAFANNVEALKGTEGFCHRIGDWRVIFAIEPDRVMVHDIGPRGSIYG